MTTRRKDRLAPARAERMESWAREYAREWYRGQSHAESDFRRFTAARRVPVADRAAVCERAQELLLEAAPERRAA